MTNLTTLNEIKQSLTFYEAFDTKKLTTVEELSQHITLLVSVEETESFFISAYLNLENDHNGWRKALEERALILRRILKGHQLTDFEESIRRIEYWMDTELHPDAKGVAIFVRGTFGGQFMLPMQFAAPLPNLIAIYSTPNIYHLVELKDNYDRYVILFAMADKVSILDVNLGAATTLALINRSELRMRVGSKWTRTHYQFHRSQRGERFLHKIEILQKLMHAGGQAHLILAGDPEITSRIRHALPTNLMDKLVDVIPASKRDRKSDVVLATLSSFIEYEEQESQSITERLIEGVRSQNLAVAGSAATLDALCWGEVDILVMASSYQPDPGWFCTNCHHMGAELPEDSICSHCAEPTVRSMDVREAILRLAGQIDCPVEVVEQSDALMALGGVGCLISATAEMQNKPPVSFN